MLARPRDFDELLLAAYTQGALLDVPDEVGAYAIHGLAVCNTPESVALVIELYRQRPALMKHLHTSHRAGIPLFVGESTLHIFAVNERCAPLPQQPTRVESTRDAASFSPSALA